MSAIRRTLLILSLVLLLVPATVGPWLIGSTRTWALSLDLAAAFAGSAVFLFRRVLPAGRNASRAAFPPAFPAFAAFVLYIALRVPFAVAPFAAAGEALRAFALLLLYAALWPMAREHGLWRALLACLLLSIACMVIYAFHQHLEHSTAVLWMQRPGVYKMRASGAYLCPNHFANWLAMGAAAALALALLPAAGAAMRLAALYALFLAIPGVYLSQSRSAILGLLAAFALIPFAVFARESKTRFALALVLVPLLVAGAGFLSIRTVPAVQTRFQDVLEDPDRAGGARLRVWHDSLAMMQAKPVEGFGPASFIWAYPPFRKHVSNTFLWDYPHNEYVGLLVEEGAAGAALFFAGGLWLFGWWVWRLSRIRSRGAAAVLAGAGAVVAASAVHAVFDFNIHIFPNAATLVALFCALCAAADEADGSAGGEASRGAMEIVRKLVAAALAVLAVWACAYAVRRFESYRQTLVGRVAADRADWDDAHAAFDRAKEACPGDPAPWAEDGSTWLTQATWFVGPDPAMRWQGKMERAAAAVASLSRSHDLHPKDLLVLGTLAYAEEMTGDDASAEAHLREWAGYDRSDIGAREALGLFLRRRGRNAEALAVFLEAKEDGFGGRTIDKNIRDLRRMAEAEAAAGGSAP
jgi:O-antigen ligase